MKKLQNTLDVILIAALAAATLLICVSVVANRPALCLLGEGIFLLAAAGLLVKNVVLDK